MALLGPTILWAVPKIWLYLDERHLKLDLRLPWTFKYRLQKRARKVHVFFVLLCRAVQDVYQAYPLRPWSRDL